MTCSSVVPLYFLVYSPTDTTSTQTPQSYQGLYFRSLAVNFGGSCGRLKDIRKNILKVGRIFWIEPAKYCANLGLDRHLPTQTCLEDPIRAPVVNFIGRCGKLRILGGNDFVQNVYLISIRWFNDG